MNFKNIIIKNLIDRKTNLLFDEHIDGCLKLNYFFSELFKYRKYYGRYPSINKWREFVVTSLLENLSKNKILKFDMDAISSDNKLKENICLYQKNKILLFEFCLSCILDFYDQNEIMINPHSMYVSHETIYERITNKFDGFSGSSEIEKNIFTRLSHIKDSNRFEKGFEQGMYLNELENELYRVKENLENTESNNLFSIDEIFLRLGYQISSKNIVCNMDYLKPIIEYEQCFLYQRLNSKNIIAKKYNEISKLFLSILNTQQKELINLRYGLDNKRRYTFVDIYEMKQYKNYKSLFEDLIKALWKLRICWPGPLIYKILFCYEEEDDEESLF